MDEELSTTLIIQWVQSGIRNPSVRLRFWRKF